MENAASSQTRIDWLDKARAYGMFLVFYGHFVETVTTCPNWSADPASVGHCFPHSPSVSPETGYPDAEDSVNSR